MASLTGYRAIRLSTGQSALKSEAVVEQGPNLGVGYFGSVLALSGSTVSLDGVKWSKFRLRDCNSSTSERLLAQCEQTCGQYGKVGTVLAVDGGAFGCYYDCSCKDVPDFEEQDGVGL